MNPGTFRGGGRGAGASAREKEADSTVSGKSRGDWATLPAACSLLRCWRIRSTSIESLITALLCAGFDADWTGYDCEGLADIVNLLVALTSPCNEEAKQVH